MPEGRPPEHLSVLGWIPDGECTNAIRQFCLQANVFCEAHLASWRALMSDTVGEALTLAALARRGRAGWAELVADDQGDAR